MSESAAAPVPDKGLFSRAIGIITSPGSTFAAVVQSPRPAGILLLCCVVMGLATGLPQFNDKVRRSALEQQIAQMERSGRPVPASGYEQMERFSHYSGYATMASMFIVMPVLCLLFAAVYWAVFNAILGGTATFKQVLGIVTHSQVIAALGAVAAVPVIYLQGVTNLWGPFTLGALLPMLEPGTPLASFANGIGFFQIWQMIVTAIGLGVLYKRKSTGIAIGLIVLYLLITAGFTTMFSSMGR
jgi:hypothetical protein